MDKHYKHRLCEISLGPKEERKKMKDFQMCKMCSLLLTLLDRIEMESEDPAILKITKQRMKIAEQMGFKVIYEGKIDSGRMQ